MADTIHADPDFHQVTGLPATIKMAPGLALFFNEQLYARCAKLATVMAKAEGTTPKHLLGKTEACFAVISRSITWNLDPFAVACSTYQTPGGSLGYEGKLIQAILENSGRFAGPILFEHVGDWSKVRRKFKLQSGQNGKGQYPVPTWGEKEAEGLSVIVRGQMKTEAEPRMLEFFLDEAFPLNSPLWATAPSRQICYTAVRAFANLAAPGVLLGVPFDVDPTGFYGEPMDINERPAKTPAKDNPFVRKPDAAEVQPESTTQVKNDDMPLPEHLKRAAPEPQGEPAAAEAAQSGEAQAAEGEPAQAQAEQTVEETARDPEPPAAAEPADETPEQALARLKEMLATQPNVRDACDLEAAGLEELPQALHADWQAACAVKQLAILERNVPKAKKR